MVYHVFNKSIASYKIFNNDLEFERIILAMKYYSLAVPKISFSKATKLNNKGQRTVDLKNSNNGKEKLVDFIAYCIMPTHVHLVLIEARKNGISTFTNNLFNSYTRYFNTKRRRKGPLWEGKTKKVLVESDEQLLHLTRYVHLNPTTANMVDRPELWPFSSYKEYLSDVVLEDRFCNYAEVLDIATKEYRIFVEDRVAYQRELGKIKKVLIE